MRVSKLDWEKAKRETTAMQRAFPDTKPKPEEDKRIIAALRLWKGMSSDKIADLLGVKKGRVKEIRKKIQAHEQSQREAIKSRRRTKFQVMQDALIPEDKDEDAPKAQKPGYPDHQIAQPGCCHWIIGDGPFRPHENWLFCNKPTGSALGVYCEEHHVIAHPKPK